MTINKKMFDKLKGRRVYQFYLDEETGKITDITDSMDYVKVIRCKDCTWNPYCEGNAKQLEDFEDYMEYKSIFPQQCWYLANKEGAYCSEGYIDPNGFNAVTVRAIIDSEQGINTEKFTSLEELWKDLGIEEDE